MSGLLDHMPIWVSFEYLDRNGAVTRRYEELIIVNIGHAHIFCRRVFFFWLPMRARSGIPETKASVIQNARAAADPSYLNTYMANWISLDAP